jgi:6-phospho-beta-glucosidase
MDHQVYQPTGMVAEAVTRYTLHQDRRAVRWGNFPRDLAVKVLGVNPEDVFYDYFGLNHLNFGYNLRIRGKALSEQEYDRLLTSATWGSVQPELLRLLRLLPSPYLRYFFHRENSVQEAKNKELTRGEQVQLIEREVFKAYANPSQVTIPEALKKAAAEDIRTH